MSIKIFLWDEIIQDFIYYFKSVCQVESKTFSRGRIYAGLYIYTISEVFAC